MILSRASAPTGDLFPPDWSQFIPDTVSGLITSAIVGLMVGALLWRWQSRSEARVLRRLAEAEWRSKRSLVATAISAPLSRREHSDNVAVHADRLTSSLLSELRLLPVGEWSDAAPGNPELRAAMELMVDGPTLTRRARALVTSLEVAVVEDGNAPGHTSRHVSWLSSRLLGNEDASQLIGDIYQGYPDTGNRVLERPDIREEVDSYLSLLGRVEANYAVLQRALAAI